MKKVIFLLLLILLLPVITLAYNPGDVDGNGKVASMDYIMVRKHLLKQSLLTGDKLERADVNNDGKVSSLDYISIRKTILNGGANPTNAATPTPVQTSNPANNSTPTSTPKPTNTPGPVRVTGVTLNKSELKVYVGGEEKTLKATVNPSNAANKKVIWSSSNEKIAKVTDGKVKGIKEGIATITVKTEDGSKKATCKVTVELKEYKITLNANGGTVSTKSIKVKDGQKYGNIPDPTYSGYKFLGWYTKAKGGDQVTSSTKATSDATIYAHWEKIETDSKTFTIEYVANNGTSEIKTQTCKKNEYCYIDKNNFKYSGKYFNGWTTKKNGHDDLYMWSGWKGTWTFKNGEHGIENNKLTLYARWSENVSSKTYHSSCDAKTFICPNRYAQIITYNNRSFHHYCQNKDTRTFGSGGGYNMDKNGCGPVALASIISGYPELSNVDALDIAKSIGQFGTMNNLEPQAKKYGFTTERKSRNISAEDVKSRLKNGWQAIVLVKGSDGHGNGCEPACCPDGQQAPCGQKDKYSSGNHFIAIVGLDKNDNMLVANPRCEKSWSGTVENMIKYYLAAGEQSGYLFVKRD